jgi:hypothetical protein
VTFSEDIPFWESVGFHERCASWIADQSPALDVISIVTLWIDRQTRVDPFRGVRRHTEIATNLWGGRVPGTVRGDTAVFCSYWIFEDMRQIRCDSLATLSRAGI